MCGVGIEQENLEVRNKGSKNRTILRNLHWKNSSEARRIYGQ